jgi:chorismate lyase / 3-hydroxybenzoate synthase
MNISPVVPQNIEHLNGERALAPPAGVHGNFARHGADATLASARIKNAVKLDAAAFERQTMAAYASIRRQVEPLHPVRFWNHIPAIHAVMDSQRDRYMVFNAGRFKAFEQWYGSSQRFSQVVATASGVGHGGSDLVIHCLATSEPGIAVENPRQISSYRYSRRYGPLPPCFARATIVPAAPDCSLLLVGGTASIRGEDSMYVDSLTMQLDETIENLASLIRAARKGDCSTGEALRQFRSLRVYYPFERDVRAIAETVQSVMPNLTHIQMIPAELCRPELLVEVEGIAEL